MYVTAFGTLSPVSEFFRQAAPAEQKPAFTPPKSHHFMACWTHDLTGPETKLIVKSKEGLTNPEAIKEMPLEVGEYTKADLYAIAAQNPETLTGFAAQLAADYIAHTLDKNHPIELRAGYKS